jgi:hypothetical protein
MGLIVLMIVIGMIGREPAGFPKAPVDRLDLDPGLAAVALRTQMDGPQCDTLIAASSVTRDGQYVTMHVPSVGSFEVQYRRPGEFTVQPRTSIQRVAGCVWNDRPIPTDPFSR